MPVSTFFISSSGVAGRAMKIKSYRRSSMMTSFPSVPGAGPAKSCRCGKRLPATSARFRLRLRGLRRLYLFIAASMPLRQNHFHRVARFADHFRGDFQLRLVHRPQHIFLAAAHFGCSGAQPSRKRANSGVPSDADHRLRAVVAAGAAFAAECESCPAATALRPTSPANRRAPARTLPAAREPKCRSDSCTSAAWPAEFLLPPACRARRAPCLPGAQRESPPRFASSSTAMKPRLCGVH